MPITVAVAITSMVAWLVHSVYLRRTYLNRREQKKSKVNGDRRRISNTFFNMELTHFASNFCWAAGTLGILEGSGYQNLGYLLALAPLLSLVSTAFALRGIR